MVDETGMWMGWEINVTGKREGDRCMKRENGLKE
jgi:hypothetical protein